MIATTDIQEILARLQEECDGPDKVPAWAEGRGLAEDALGAAIGWPAAMLAPMFGTPEQISDEAREQLESQGIDPSEVTAVGLPSWLVHALMLALVIGVEIGRIPRVNDDDLPDIENVLDDDDDR